MLCTCAKHLPQLAKSSVKMEPNGKVSEAGRSAQRVYVRPVCWTLCLQPNPACLKVFDPSLSRVLIGSSCGRSVHKLWMCPHVSSSGTLTHKRQSVSHCCPHVLVHNRDLLNETSAESTELLSCLLGLRSASVWVDSKLVSHV